MAQHSLLTMHISTSTPAIYTHHLAPWRGNADSLCAESCNADSTSAESMSKCGVRQVSELLSACVCICACMCVCVCVCVCVCSLRM